MPSGRAPRSLEREQLLELEGETAEQRGRENVEGFFCQLGVATERPVGLAFEHLDQLELRVDQPVLAHTAAIEEPPLHFSSVLRVLGERISTTSAGAPWTFLSVMMPV